MTSEVERRPAPVAPAIVAPSLRPRIYGFGASTANRCAIRVAPSSPSRSCWACCSSAWLRDRQEFNAPTRVSKLVAVVAVVPAILAGPGRRVVNVEHPRRLSPVQATGRSSRSSSASGRSSPSPALGDRRRDEAAWSSSPPRRRPAARIALEALRPPDRPGDRSPWSSSPPCSSSVDPSNGLPGDEITVQMAAGYAIWLFLLGIARRRGRVRARAVRRAAGRPSASPGAVMFGGFILNGYQAAIPANRAPVPNLTWFGWTAEPRSARRAVRLGDAAAGRRGC